MLEIEDRVGQARVRQAGVGKQRVARERPPGRREDPGHARVGQRLAKDLPADQTGGAQQQQGLAG